MNNDQVALLKCTSAYPAPMDEANLRTIPDLAARFGTVAGFSDHTPGIAAPVVAVSLGAAIIEKHFILDRTMGGPDADFSLEPAEFARMVEAVRTAEVAMGEVSYELSGKTKRSREFARSLFVVEDMNEGDRFTGQTVRSIRPGYGLPPKHLREIMGCRSNRDIPRGTPLSWEMIDKEDRI